MKLEHLYENDEDDEWAKEDARRFDDWKKQNPSLTDGANQRDYEPVPEGSQGSKFVISGLRMADQRSNNWQAMTMTKNGQDIEFRIEPNELANLIGNRPIVTLSSDHKLTVKKQSGRRVTEDSLSRFKRMWSGFVKKVAPHSFSNAPTSKIWETPQVYAGKIKARNGETYVVDFIFRFEKRVIFNDDNPNSLTNVNRPGVELTLSITTEVEQENQRKTGGGYDFIVFMIYNNQYNDFCDFLGVPRIDQQKFSRAQSQSYIDTNRSAAFRSNVLQSADDYLAKFK